jgi:hypothetical protein
MEETERRVGRRDQGGKERDKEGWKWKGNEGGDGKRKLTAGEGWVMRK